MTKYLKKRRRLRLSLLKTKPERGNAMTSSTSEGNAGVLWAKKGRLGWVYKSLDAALTAHLRPKEGVRLLFQALLQRRSSNYNRISSLLNLLDQVQPGFAEGMARNLIRVKNFPLAGYRISLLAYGSGSTVFLLKNGQGQKVLKVYRRSLGQPARQAWEVAKEYQDKHKKLVTWFNNEDQIVIPSQFLVLHGPLLGIPSAALLQPYVSGKIYDLFLDFTIMEAIRLAKGQEQLRLQLLNFTSRLFQAMDETGLCFDLVGRENLMLVEESGRMHLKIADNGIFQVQPIRSHSPAIYDRLRSHLHRLQLISKGL